MRQAILMALALLVAPVPATSLSLLSQSRGVTASAGYAPLFQPGVIEDSQSESAAGFSPFSGAAEAHAAGFRRSSDSSATQASSIVVGPQGSLETLSSGEVEAGAGAGGADDAFASSGSTYLLTFELTSDQPYELVATATVTADVNVQVLVELTRNGSEVIEQMMLATFGSGGLDTDTLDASGVLNAGTYALRVDAFASAVAIGHTPLGTGGMGEGTFDVTLRVLPEPGAPALLLLGVPVLVRRRASTALRCGRAPASRA